MVESFISTQKHSVHKALRDRFRRYLVAAADYHSLLLHALRTLLREEQRAQAAVNARLGAPAPPSPRRARCGLSPAHASARTHPPSPPAPLTLLPPPSHPFDRRGVGRRGRGRRPRARAAAGL